MLVLLLVLAQALVLVLGHVPARSICKMVVESPWGFEALRCEVCMGTTQDEVMTETGFPWKFEFTKVDADGRAAQ